jgi:hypothetical protein
MKTRNLRKNLGRVLLLVVLFGFLVLPQPNGAMTQPNVTGDECCLKCEALALRCQGTLQRCCRLYELCRSVCTRLGGQCGSCPLGP